MTTAIQTKSRISRLAGGMIAETNGDYYLIGELKEPCDFTEFGFEQPEESTEGSRLTFRKLVPADEITLEHELYLQMNSSGEDLAKLLVKRFVIERNNSVSNRLWNLVVGETESGAVDARWLENIPDDVWDIVRDNILRCV